MVPEASSGASLAAPAASLRLHSDARLARRAAAGDQRAFEAIYRRFHQDLYRFCLALTGNPPDAQDALQNAMVKVLRALPGEEREIKLKPWLYRIAHNEAMETIRRRRDHAELDAEQMVNPADIAATAEAREQLHRLLADLAELPERQRGALVMREMAGLGFEQIADSLDTSPAVARQTVYEARLSLRQMEAGREMSCDEVTRQLSDGDGRVVRRREIRTHLRDCESCRAFRDAIKGRRAGFAAIAPLPIAAAAGLLHGAGVASASGGVGLGGAAATTSAVATSAALKSAAVVAIVAVAGVTAAERSHLIDVPIVGGGSSTAASEAPSAGGKAAGSRAARAPAATAGQNGGGAGGDAAKRGSSKKGSKNDSAGDGSAGAPAAASSGKGGGHGAHRGRPEGLPSASSHGQETAAANKSPSAPASPPGPSGEPPRSNGSEAAPEPPPAQTPPPAPSESAGGGNGNGPPPQSAAPESSPPPGAGPGGH